MSEKRFVGTIGRTVEDTEYRYEVNEKLPKGAPNVLYILLDDLGFAGLGCYGSNINTPNMDRLADEGLRYNNFHTTAICSATRACLLTGAGHHEAGVQSIIEMPNGTPNAQGHLDPSYATIAEILKEYDYSTYHAGKWHLTAANSPSGPFEDWPLGKGFDRSYGFLLAETDHFHPQLVRDNSFVPQPKSVAEGYHVTEDITDQAIDYLFNHVNTYDDKPFFLYLAYGAVHAPHHAPKEYIDKYKGKFDEGWDKAREEWFANQKAMGLIPDDAELTDRAPFVEAWDDLDDNHKKLYARYMEVFAGTLEYTDAQIGRVIDFLRDADQLDNTIIVLMSDNGASAEGGREGRVNRFTGIDITNLYDDAEYGLEHIDEIGGEYSFPQYPSGWANALNTPFQWYKIWTHEGGIKDPMIIRYPAAVKNPGTVQNQYIHVSDVTPTVLDLIGIKKPNLIKGVGQKPFTGTSFKYTFDQPDAPSRKKVQYYEVFGNRAIYKDGWKAVANHEFTDDYSKDIWELYNVEKDYSEKYNMAEKYPEKLRELQEDFLIEAGRHNVFPMVVGDTHAFPGEHKGFFGNIKIPAKDKVYKNIFKPFSIPENTGINLTSANHYAEFEIERTENDEGVLFSNGDRFGGYSFYIKDNTLKFVYNQNRKNYYEVKAENLPYGKLSVRYDVIFDGESAVVTLSVNGDKKNSVKVEKRYFQTAFNSATLRANFYTEVSPEYEVPFEFTGTIYKVHMHNDPAEMLFEEALDKASAAE